MNISSSLSKLLAYVSEHSPFYKELYRELEIDVTKIKTLDDFATLPFTNKDDLALRNEDFICVGKDQIKEYVTTSGTLGEPVAFCLTEKDLARLGQNEWQSMQLIGATSSDIFQLMVTMDRLFMAGLAYYLGIKKLGASLIRTGPGNPMGQIDSILRFNPTVLIAVPSFIIKVIEVAKERQIDLNQTSVKSIICIGESIRTADFELNELGKGICDSWNVKLFSTYASTEMATAFTECDMGMGTHLNEDLLFLEVLDENNHSVESAEMGEVVVTPLDVEGLPLIRYRTGDLCHVFYEPCPCGLATPRLGPVIGRKQQMIKYKGTTLFPAAIIEVLVKEQIDLYQIVVKSDTRGIDVLNILLPAKHENERFEVRLKECFSSRLRVIPEFEFMREEDLSARVFPGEKRKPQWVVFEKI